MSWSAEASSARLCCRPRLLLRSSLALRARERTCYRNRKLQVISYKLQVAGVAREGADLLAVERDAVVEVAEPDHKLVVVHLDVTSYTLCKLHAVQATRCASYTLCKLQATRY